MHLLNSGAAKVVNLLLLTILFSWTAMAEEAVKKSVKVFKETPQGKLKMHIYQPADAKKGDKRPAIVFFFGGGWVGGSPAQFFAQCEHFAKLGFVAFSAEYRVAKKHKTSPFECVKDGKSAVRWLRENAGEWGIDPDKIVAAGGSAGGHVACTTGVIEGFEEGNTKISSKPNAMILFNPVLDTTSKGYGASKVKGREKEISPCHHIRKDLPPTLILTGTADTVTPLENAERFNRLMKEAGNTCQLVPFEGQKHGFFNSPKFRKNLPPKNFNKTMK